MRRRDFMISASAALSAPAVLRAQTQATLRFSSWLPAASLITENLFLPWAEEVALVTEGRVGVEILPAPLGPPPAHLDLLLSGEADVAYSLHGYSGDAFERAKIGQFSFLGDAYSVSQAFSKVYRDMLGAEDEHEGLKMLGVFQHGPGVLMLKDKVVRGPEDYRGLRVRTSGGYIAGLMADLGAENVPMSPTAVRQALIDGTIDGVAFPYEAAPAFGIVDQITFVSELPNGYYNATWFLGMSDEAAGRIAAEDLAAIRDHAASFVHVLAAKSFDYADYLGKEAMLAAGIPIEPTSPELTGHIAAIAENYEARWVAGVDGAGYDGASALAELRRLSGSG